MHLRFVHLGHGIYARGVFLASLPGAVVREGLSTIPSLALVRELREQFPNEKHFYLFKSLPGSVETAAPFADFKLKDLTQRRDPLVINGYAGNIYMSPYILRGFPGGDAIMRQLFSYDREF